ncbi:MAG: hypothetical protein V2A54_01280 [Bacteroidota bacterium]
MKKIFIMMIALIAFTGLKAQKEGCVSGDCENGFGVYVFGSDTDWAGDKYEGYWKNGKREGKGTYTYANGSKYVGNTIANKRNGYGVFTWASGDKYEGGWKDGKKHGDGKYYFADGTSKTGTWVEDVYQETTTSDQKVTTGKKTGCISGDCSNGFGTYVFESGEKYAGNWKNDERNGKGTNYFASGASYTGEWKDDKKHGQGSYTYKPESTLEKYDGTYIAGSMEGQGTLTYKDGRKYVGGFHNDLFDGTGVYTEKDGTKKTGKWKCDMYLGTGVSSQITASKTTGNLASDSQTDAIKISSKANPCYAAFSFKSKEVKLHARLLGSSGKELGDFDLSEGSVIKLTGGGDFTIEVYCTEGAGKWEVVFVTQEQYDKN